MARWKVWLEVEDHDPSNDEGSEPFIEARVVEASGKMDAEIKVIGEVAEAFPGHFIIPVRARMLGAVPHS